MYQIYTPIASRGGTVTTAAAVGLTDLGFTAAQIAAAWKATVTSGSQAVRLLWTGSDPTSTVGHYLGTNQNCIVEGKAAVSNLKIIAISDSSAVTVTLESLTGAP